MFYSKPSSADAAALSCAPSRPLSENASLIGPLQRPRPIVDKSKSSAPRSSAARPQLTDAQKVERILQAFNTWSFKREQPDSPAGLMEAISRAVATNTPVPFVLYWGKGPRSSVGTPEIACLEFLHSLAERIRAVYAIGASFKLIFTDTHANLNGHAPEAIESYFASVRAEAGARGFEDCRLSTLVESLQTGGPDNDNNQELPDEHTLVRLSECAAKWYRGEGNADQGAVEYFRMNMVEKRAVQHAFPQSIFITFNGSEFRSLFPDRMPIFYMYSLKRGVSSKPWFLPNVAV